MATIFLSYRRTDSPQACRVYEWLVQRLGEEAIFMDVAGIPLAVDFAEYIRQEISCSAVVVVLIGSDWLSGIEDSSDPVRLEIETAIARDVPLMPVLIGNTPMPDPTELPEVISELAFQNAVTVGVSRDFHTHMRVLMAALESILANGGSDASLLGTPELVGASCQALLKLLEENYSTDSPMPGHGIGFRIYGPLDFVSPLMTEGVSLTLHRVRRISDSLELSFILSFWSKEVSRVHLILAWTMAQLERTPVIPISAHENWSFKVRPSDEDVRQIWKMVTDTRLQLSLPYVGLLKLGSAEK